MRSQTTHLAAGLASEIKLVVFLAGLRALPYSETFPDACRSEAKIPLSGQRVSLQNTLSEEICSIKVL